MSRRYSRGKQYTMPIKVVDTERSHRNEILRYTEKNTALKPAQNAKYNCEIEISSLLQRATGKLLYACAVGNLN